MFSDISNLKLATVEYLHHGNQQRLEISYAAPKRVNYLTFTNTPEPFNVMHWDPVFLETL